MSDCCFLQEGFCSIELVGVSDKEQITPTSSSFFYTKETETSTKRGGEYYPGNDNGQGTSMVIFPLLIFLLSFILRKATNFTIRNQGYKENNTSRDYTV
jgi:hypothetical protein